MMLRNAPIFYPARPAKQEISLKTAEAIWKKYESLK